MNYQAFTNSNLTLTYEGVRGACCGRRTALVRPARLPLRFLASHLKVAEIGSLSRPEGDLD